MKRLLIFSLLIAGVVPACTTDGDLVIETVDPGVTYEPLQPLRVNYGPDALQFGELRLPEGDGPFPVIMIIHGGCWLSQFDLTLMTEMAGDLTRHGFATWNVEYRRTSDPGGGWPGTFLDVANGLKHLSVLAEDYPVDLDRLVITGHSAGGHLALWLGAHRQLEPTSELFVEGLPAISGIVSLAGITDLSTYYSPSGCGANTDDLVGGYPDDFPDRYSAGSPITYLPLGIPQRLIQGENDNIVPPSHVAPYYERASSRGDDIDLISIADAGHFEVITPGSIAWPAIVEAFEELASQ